MGWGWKGIRREAAWRRRDLLEVGSGAVEGVETAYTRSGPASGTGSRHVPLETEGVRALDVASGQAAASAHTIGVIGGDESAPAGQVSVCDVVVTASTAAVVAASFASAMSRQAVAS